MEPFFADYLERLENLHRHLDGALAGLSVEELDWVPGPDMNSIAVIVTHLAGAERFWTGDVAGRRPSGRVRAEEFHAHGLDAAALRARLADVLAVSREVVAGLTLADLAQPRPVPGDSGTRTAGWALLHTLDHVALHLGHVELTLEMLEARPESRH